MPYAVIVDGDPREVFAGQPFKTSQMRITTEAEAAWALVPIGTVIDHPLSHPANALAAYGAEDRDRYLIHSFSVPATPDGKVRTGYTLSRDGETVVADATFTDPPVPAEVSRMQAKQALRIAGKLDAVETAVADASDEVKIYWADASSFHRDHPTLQALATALQMTSDEVDDLFRAAAAIT